MATIHRAGRVKEPTAACVYGACEASPSITLDLPICDRHAIKVYRAVSAATSGLAEHRTTSARPQSATTRGSVYFFRQGERIKIGFSTNVKQRIKDFGAGQLLGTMPGTMHTERQMHERFAHLRDAGEWFRPGPDLEQFCHALAA